MRPLIAAALLGAVLVGGFFYGAVQAFREDTGPDW